MQELKAMIKQVHNEASDNKDIGEEIAQKTLEDRKMQGDAVSEKVKSSSEFDSRDNSNYTFVFDANETYLLFAFKKNDKFYVYPCSYSGKVDDSRKTVHRIKRYLRNRGGSMK